MFDVSFSELMVIGVVALVVIGPERLPRVARTVGHLLGRLQRYVNNVKSDINREMHLEDLKRFEQQVRSEVGGIESAVNKELVGIESSVEQAIAPSTETLPPTEMAAVPSPGHLLPDGLPVSQELTSGQASVQTAQAAPAAETVTPRHV